MFESVAVTESFARTQKIPECAVSHSARHKAEEDAGDNDRATELRLLANDYLCPDGCPSQKAMHLFLPSLVRLLTPALYPNPDPQEAEQP